MALEGQLSDFNVAEILQLIAGQKKSGFLTLDGRRTMVFVFDKGFLISTRDRRNLQQDPLDNFLRAYGFLTEAQWRNIEYIKQNSSLDLTEVLVSEEIFDDKRMQDILRLLAQEMVHEAMKLRRGRYQFTATNEAPRGVRGRLSLDVQGLLMEAARRLDEETRLAETFTAPVVNFRQGPVDPELDDWSESRKRMYRLALTGEPLGKLLRYSQLDQFSAKEILLALCEDGFLAMNAPVETEKRETKQRGDVKQKKKTGLRSVTLTILVSILLLGTGFLRWAPLVVEGAARIGLADGTAAIGVAAADTLRDAPRREAHAMRLRQIEDEVREALDLFHFRHGEYPVDLSQLVQEGLVEPTLYRRVVDLKWTYRLQDDGRSYSLAA